jgi:uncharacterized protein YndB with AHSA1/START domain
MTTKNATATGYDYSVSRLVDAPVEQVWAAWTQEHHYETWFHAVPGSVSLDVRPGGAFRTTMTAPDGSQHPLTGSYREVVENQRLVTAMDVPGREPAAMTMELTDLGGKTQIVLSQTCDTVEERDMSKQGSEILLQWCAEYVSTI